MENLGNLMIDIETMGNKSQSVICSLAAVEFDILTGQTGRSFYEKSSIQSCLDIGLKVNGDTIEWWLSQVDKARQEISGGGKNITEVLHKFRLFLESLGTENLQIWGNSPRFDLGILEDAYIATKHQIPWNFRLERDLRTLVAFAPEIKRNCQVVGVAHFPIDDCLFQIEYCCAIWKKLNII
ncbi:MAG: 3'-5' exonuclease [Candidatus Pacearchaeota archaeon]|jgi:hypothetical protein